jgi:hypothetical protein
MASGPGFRLIVRRGPQPNQIYELTKDVVTLGRDITNDIVISDPEVSRHHIRLTRTGTGYAVEDLDSTNGAFVNKQRVRGTHPLKNGDEIGIGETVVLAYEAIGVAVESEATLIGSGAPAAPPAAAPAARPAPRFPGVGAPPAGEEDVGMPVNRTVLIGCAAILVLACCALGAAGLFLPSEVWCQIPVGNTIPVLCVP